ncbi:MAG: DUF5985 family protein [Candidatus Entotheonellia bacterium]
MAKVIYALCTLPSLTCAWLLLRSFTHNRYRLLFWSGLCFVGLSVNNMLVVLDKVVLPSVDLLTWRLVAGLVAVLLLLYGLIWEDE